MLVTTNLSSQVNIRIAISISVEPSVVEHVVVINADIALIILNNTPYKHIAHRIC
jgi:hypothetical protein